MPPSDHIHEPEVEGQELVAPDVVGQEDADDDALPAPSVGTSAPRIQAASPLPKMRHDLRTPLNQIIGYTELLQETAGDDVQPDLAKIRTAALNLLDGLNRAFDQIAGMITGTTPEAPPVESIPRSLAATRAQVTPADEAAHPSPYRGARLLVVDDNEMNRAVLSQRLQRRGFEVETADGGETALQAIAERSFDLVLLDVMMPGIGGLEVLRRVRATRPMSELPIIMATARDGSGDVVEALGQGANDYVTKPIDMPVLLARANTQLALREANERIRKLAEQLETRNRFIAKTFGRYLSDEVVENLLATPGGLALGGESRTVTILLSDLRGFSSMSERLTPPQVVSVLNEYLGAMTEVIVRHGGTIDEFIGDAILVIFGAPVAREDDAARAIACALEMQLATEVVNARFREMGLPHIEMGVGINTGEVVVGNIGSDRRAKYGVVGRNVNLASRIEALTVGGQVLVSESTLEAAGPIVRVERTMDVCPKGAPTTMRIYEIGGIGGKYGISVPRSRVELVTLPEALPVEFAVMDGVNAPPSMTPAHVTALSRKEAVLVTTVTIEPIATVKLRIGDVASGGFRPGYGYGKVLGREDGGKHRVHFTSLPPEIEEMIAGIVGA